MKAIYIISMAIMLSACGHSGTNVIESANTIRAIQSITTAGVKEEVLYCMKDIFDPHNRGSGC